MATKATIFKAELNISDMDRGHYRDYALTIARHPSETDQRMMVRLLAFVFHAAEQLQFTRGLSTDDEPDLWQKTLTDEIALWIDVGLPDERRIRKACGRAERVVVYAYGARTVAPWWASNRDKLERLDKLTVYSLPVEVTDELTLLTQRNMKWQCMIQDGQLWINSGDRDIQATRIQLLPR